MTTSTPVKQSGIITPGHIAVWTANGVIADGGTSPQPPQTNVAFVEQSGHVTPDHLVKWVSPGIVADAGTSGTSSTLIIVPAAAADGVTDDAPALNAFFTALATGANIGFIPAGEYAVASTVKWGNGSNTQRSTVRGNTVIFEGGDATSAALATGVASSGVRFKWIGGAGGTVFEIAGPISGLRSIGFPTILCENLAARGVALISVGNSQFDGFAAFDWTATGVEFNTRPVTMIDGIVDEISTATVSVDDITSFGPITTNGKAVVIDGYQAAGGLDTSQLRIGKVTCGISGNGGTGVYYGYSDFTYINMLVVLAYSALSNNPAGVRFVGIAAPFSANFPQNHVIEKCAFSGGLDVIIDEALGTVGPNFINYYSTNDGAVFPNNAGAYTNFTGVGAEIVGTLLAGANGFPTKIRYGLSSIVRCDAPGNGGVFIGCTTTDAYVANYAEIFSLGRNGNNARVSGFDKINFETGATTGAGTGTITMTLKAGALVNAINDAAAAIAGVAVGELYRNGSVVQIRVT